jgi:hypothetical protein
MTTATKTPTRRPLADLRVGISISEAELPVLQARGLTAADVNDVTVELCRRLVSLGAQVVLGHQWRPGGVMEAVAKFAQVYQPESREPIIHNFLAYPDHAALSASDRERLKGVVVIYDDDEKRKALPRRTALRHMRDQMADVVHARICLCGEIKQPEGFVPGVIEEVVLTLSRDRPVYVSAMMGGISEALTMFLRGDRDAFATATQPYDPSTVAWRESPQFKKYMNELLAFDLPRLASRSGLELTELEELFDAQNVDSIVYLTTRGLINRFRAG